MGGTVITSSPRPTIQEIIDDSNLSKELKDYLRKKDMEHIRGAPYHPMTQGKIKRWHRSMKNVVELQNYYSPSELKVAIVEFVQFYNYKRYHVSIDNLTLADVYFARKEEVLSNREKIKQQTLRMRCRQNLLHNQFN